MLHQVSTLPAEAQALMHLLPTLPSLNSPTQFPPLFPISALPLVFQDPEKLSYGLWSSFHTLAPNEAAKWHWRDIRKVRRHLEIYLSEQEVVEEESEWRVLVYWLYAEREGLEGRLDARVDKMLRVSIVFIIWEKADRNV